MILYNEIYSQTTEEKEETGLENSYLNYKHTNTHAHTLCLLYIYCLLLYIVSFRDFCLYIILARAFGPDLMIIIRFLHCHFYCANSLATFIHQLCHPKKERCAVTLSVTLISARKLNLTTNNNKTRKKRMENISSSFLCQRKKN